jgi:nitrite reductase (NADH) small subunit
VTAWVDVSPLDKLIPGRGVCALVGELQIAVFRIAGEEIYAISNFDPFSRAFVLSRGIVGSRAERLKVASPVYKHNFDLDTGVCLDDATVTLPTYQARVVDGMVQVLSP